MSAPIMPVPAVNVAILNSRREILLTRRSPSVREPGKWCLPGGHFDPGETWERAAIREVEEEVGLKVTGLKLLGVYSDPDLTVTMEPVRNGHRAQFIVACFLITSFTGEVRPNFEVDAWEWFPEGKLPEPILKSHPIRVRDAFAFRGESFIR